MPREKAAGRRLGAHGREFPYTAISSLHLEIRVSVSLDIGHAEKTQIFCESTRLCHLRRSRYYFLVPELRNPVLVGFGQGCGSEHHS